MRGLIVQHITVAYVAQSSAWQTNQGKPQNSKGVDARFPPLRCMAIVRGSYQRLCLIALEELIPSTSNLLLSLMHLKTCDSTLVSWLLPCHNNTTPRAQRPVRSTCHAGGIRLHRSNHQLELDFLKRKQPLPGLPLCLIVNILMEQVGSVDGTLHHTHPTTPTTRTVPYLTVHQASFRI